MFAIATCSSKKGRRLTRSKGIANFYFSSRRRHTRSYGYWSSDVCSSDLHREPRDLAHDALGAAGRAAHRPSRPAEPGHRRGEPRRRARHDAPARAHAPAAGLLPRRSRDRGAAGRRDGAPAEDRGERASGDGPGHLLHGVLRRDGGRAICRRGRARPLRQPCGPHPVRRARYGLDDPRPGALPTRRACQAGRRRASPRRLVASTWSATGSATCWTRGWSAPCEDGTGQLTRYARGMAPLEHVRLAPHCTMGVGGPARFFVEVQDEAAVLAALEWARGRGVPLYVLGGGSNLVVGDEGIEALVVKIALRGIY